MRQLLILSFVIAVHSANSPLKEAIQFCESYVQCSAVTILEERLCLGNSYERPYWLPDPEFDKYNCHQKLRNDYILLERMEEKLDDLLTECLITNTVPLTAEKQSQCNERLLKETVIFSFGHSIHYIPTNCFNGLNIRRGRQCDEVQACCPAMIRCSSISTQSDLAKSIERVRLNLIKRAKECENGTEIEKLQLPQVCLNDKQVDTQISQHLTDRVNEAAITKGEEKPIKDDGEHSSFSSGEGSGYDVSTSGYETSGNGASDEEITQALTPHVDASGSEHEEGSGIVAEASSSLRDGGNDNVQIYPESTTPPLISWL